MLQMVENNDCAIKVFKGAEANNFVRHVHSVRYITPKLAVFVSTKLLGVLYRDCTLPTFLPLSLRAHRLGARCALL